MVPVVVQFAMCASLAWSCHGARTLRRTARFSGSGWRFVANRDISCSDQALSHAAVPSFHAISLRARERTCRFQRICMGTRTAAA